MNTQEIEEAIARGDTITKELANALTALLAENERLKRDCEAQHGDLLRCNRELLDAANNTERKLALVKKERDELKAKVFLANDAVIPLAEQLATHQEALRVAKEALLETPGSYWSGKAKAEALAKIEELTK